MKNILIFIGLLLAPQLLQAQAPTVYSPTNGQVFYAGETMNIQWHSTNPGAWSFISIMWQDSGNGTAEWIASYPTPNDGSYTWTVSKDTTWYTNFTITVSDGGSGANETVIPIIIMNGTRPPAPQAVPIQIKKAVAVEWTANTNDVYQVQSSPDLKTWTTVVQGQAPSTNASVVFYADQPSQYFRVYDLTQ
jgi:hypothetical protein